MFSVMLNYMQIMYCFIQLSGWKRNATNFKLILSLLNNGPRMVFNPAKCEFLRCNDDEHLTWNDHVKTAIGKANKVEGFLQCNIKYCPSIVKARCYNYIDYNMPLLFGLCTPKRTLIY